MLRLDDHWIWDSWVADDGELFHLFFLQAPRSLGDPARRHVHAVIGHATSRDLSEWRYRGVVLAPEAGRWDDLALWTGSVVRGADGRWRMFYTAINTGGHGVNDQRIGVAISEDLFSWTRVGDGPVVPISPRWYKTLGPDTTASETWRDPFVFADPAGDGWRMLICARAKGAGAHDDGVLAQARSADLLHWEVGPPVSDAGAGFGQLEVAQVQQVGDEPVLVFTGSPQGQTQRRRDRFGRYSTWTVSGSSVTGPWDIANAQPFTAHPSLFAAPLVRQRDGQWVLLGFDDVEAEGRDGLYVRDPTRVSMVEGRLVALPCEEQI